MFILLFVSSLIGMSIGMLGMGGVFLTPILILIADLPTSTAMGTSLATFIGTGLLGSYIYHRQGNINWNAALLLGVMSIIGALFGSRLNLALAPEALQLILAVFLAVIGIFTILRNKIDILQTNWSLELTSNLNKFLFGLIGIGVGIASGLLGVGGPVLLVPILILVGWSIRTAVGISQVVSVFAAVSGTVNYLLSGRINLAAVYWALGGELAGVVIGGYIAHQIKGDKLKVILGVALIGLSIYFTLT